MNQIASYLLCLSIISFAQSQISLYVGEVGEKSEPQYYPAAKCSFVLQGEFSYEQAKRACSSRNASLAFFSTVSEEATARLNIDWKKTPGFKMSPKSHCLTGQLWIAVKRLPDSENSENQWTWDTPLLPQGPIPFTAWAEEIIKQPIQLQRGQDFQCVVMRVSHFVLVLSYT